MATTERDPDFEALLELLKRDRGFDFTGYKRTSLQRRVDKRMQAVGTDDYREYARRLQEDDTEYSELFNTVLINVTAFFRDDVPWQVLANEVLPRMLEDRAPDSQIRVWSAGCATGEEAYTLAMVLAETLGLNAYRERVKIYATDIDDNALARARHASYTDKEIEGVPPDLLERYFERNDNRYLFRKDLRRTVIFGRNDLIQDAPISRVDILVCRNTLMYFDSRTQEKILARFHFALNEGGLLFLGRAETLLTHSNLFVPLDLKRRIFTKTPRMSLRDRLLAASPAGIEDGARPTSYSRLREAGFESSSTAQLVVDRNGFVILASGRARTLFGISASDVGRPLQDLELSYKPVDLRSRIDEAYAERRPVTISDVPWHQGEERWFDVTVTPLGDGTGGALGASILFTEVTAYKRLQRELEHANEELEAAYEELQSTNEELETTNEELQSTVEELETTNEELQSTNEELETMNEELQATNEELQTINDELRRRSDELNVANDFLASVFESMHGGVVVIDPQLHVLVWNHQAEDLWGLRADEVEGSHLLNLDIGLPVDQLRPAIRASLTDGASEHEVTLVARNRRGKTISCRVTATPLRSRYEKSVSGVILMMEERPHDGDGA
ncbi:MAG TPA: CheR family methyltransferase [Gemmatimonadaceae bacterium]|nr:CheR family methyltransferase [Gemmatimonadaceae bacterium]